MKKEAKEVRKYFVTLRMNKDELTALKSLKAKTTERSLSNYVRKIVLQKPVIVKYRNASADDFIKEMTELKRELNAIGNNLNQAVKKLHLLSQIPEFRSWIRQYERLHLAILTKADEIKSRIIELYEQWLQK